MIPWYYAAVTAFAGPAMGFVLCALFTMSALAEARGKVEWLRQKYNRLLEKHHASVKRTVKVVASSNQEAP